MTDLTPREKEMLAALKRVQQELRENGMGMGWIDSIVGCPKPKPKPKPPRRWVVECVYQGRDESPMWGRHNYISNIIREVKPITRAQIDAVIWEAEPLKPLSVRDMLVKLGIEVED